MALSLGATTPTALYLGTTAISAAYLGATQVYTTGGGDAYAIGGASPELVAAFTTQGDGTTAGEYYRKASSETTFSGLFTHSVSGLLTMLDSSGTLCYAPHNFVPYSNNFTLGWSLVFATITTDAISAFGLSGIKLVSASGQTRNEINDVLPASSVPRRLRVVAKAAEWSWISIHHDGPNSAVWYDIGTGAVGLQQSGGVGEITPLGDGWYACDFISPNWTNGRNVFIRATNANAVGSTGDGTSGIYILCVNQWDDRLPMAENPDAPDAALPWYVETTGAAKYLPRRQAYRYNSGWELAGMQMEAAAATNLFDYSTDFSNAAWAKTRGAVSSDAATGLDGNTGNFLFTCNTTSGLGAFFSDTVSVSSGTRYCFWAVLEYSNVQWIHLRVNDGSAIGGWFDIQNGATGSTTGSETNDIGIVSIGSGKYLCFVDFTPNATTSATFYAWIAAGGDGTLNCVSGDAFYCYHMQMEVGSVPSSPIITTGSTVTRAAETLTRNGAASAFGATEVTIAWDALLTSDGNGPVTFEIAPAAGGYLRVYPRNISSTYARYYGAGAIPDDQVVVTQAQGGLIPAGVNQAYAGALGNKANDEIQLVINGNAGTAVSTTTIDDFSGEDMTILKTEGGIFIRTYREWSTKLPEADLITAGTAS